MTESVYEICNYKKSSPKRIEYDFEKGLEMFTEYINCHCKTNEKFRKWDEKLDKERLMMHLSEWTDDEAFEYMKSQTKYDIYIISHPNIILSMMWDTVFKDKLFRLWKYTNVIEVYSTYGWIGILRLKNIN